MMRGRDIKISGPFLWGIRIMAIIPAFQAGDAGSIPVFPSILSAQVVEWYTLQTFMQMTRARGRENIAWMLANSAKVLLR